MADRFLCQKQLAKRWGISHRTLENWRYRGHGLPFLKLGSKVFYRIEDVEAYEALQAQAGDLMLSARAVQFSPRDGLKGIVTRVWAAGSRPKTSLPMGEKV